MAVGSGAGRRWGGRAGAGPPRPEGGLEADPTAGGADHRAGRGGGDAARDRRGDRVSTFSVRNALGRVASGGRPAAGAAGDSAGAGGRGSGAAGPGAPGRRSGRWRGGGCWARALAGVPPGARYPLAGLLLALPALEATGPAAAREVYGRLKDGFYGLTATLLTVVFLALAGEPRAEGATRVPPAALGRVLGLDRAPEVKTIRRKLGELAAAEVPVNIGIMAMGMAGWFIAQPDQMLGTLYMRDTTLRFVVNPRLTTFAGPLAILVDGTSASTSEIMAEGLKDLGRARIFGSQTAGAALPSVFEKLPDGDGFQYAIANYISEGGKPLEGLGVTPDVETPLSRGGAAGGPRSGAGRGGGLDRKPGEMIRRESADLRAG